MSLHLMALAYQLGQTELYRSVFLSRPLRPVNLAIDSHMESGDFGKVRHRVE